MSTKPILALDLSSNIGWALGRRDAEKPRTGVWTLPRAAVDMLATFAAAENAVLDAIAVHQPDLIAIEAPLPIQAQTDTFTAELMFGLDAVVRSAIWRHEIATVRCSVSDVRKHAIGSSRLGREPKKAVLAHVAERGWPIVDHNAADAALLWMFVRDGKHTRRAAA